MVKRAVVVLCTMVLWGCDAPYWVKQEREDADRVKTRAEELRRWRAEEHRRQAALCLDIAKLEKQWNNFAEWAFVPSTGYCVITYKKTKIEQMSPRQCATEWLGGEGERDGTEPSASAPDWKKAAYLACISETFRKSWSVGPDEEAEESPVEAVTEGKDGDS